MQSFYIDWNKPFIQASVQSILEDNSLGAVDDQTRLDLSSFVFVFPSGRAMRTFEEVLARKVEQMIAERKLRTDWIPPETLTVSNFPELLYSPSKPFAEKPAALLAWQGALQNESVKDLFLALSDKTDFTGYLSFAAYLDRLHREIASEGFSFSSPRQKIEKKYGIPEEVKRWNILCEAQKKYYGILEENGLCDKQVERLRALKEDEIHTEKTLVFFGAADLNRLQKKMIDRVSDKVILFIQAQGDAKDLFDEYGCVLPEKWEDRQIKIRPAWIALADDPVQEGDLAAYYTHWFGTDGGADSFRRSRIAVSLLDSEIRPYLSERLAELGVEVHFGEGRPFAAGRVALLLRGAADYLRSQSYDAFAAWIRHPDVEKTLRCIAAGESEEDASKRRRQEKSDCREGVSAVLSGNSDTKNTADWFTALDDYRNKYVPQQIPIFDEKIFSLFKKDNGDDWHEKRIFTLIGRLIYAVRGVLSCLNPKQRMPLTEYPSRINKFLANFYSDSQMGSASSRGEAADTVLPEDHQINEGLKILYKAFNEIVALPAGLIPELLPGEAIDFVLRCASGEIREENSDEAVDVFGWLDARFEETPNLILAGFNEGVIPESSSSDAFLPDTVRTDVEIENNARRYARDAYFLTTIVSRLSEKDGLRILFARTGGDGSPIRPSRLLFAEDEEMIAERVEKFFCGSRTSENLPGELDCYYTEEAPAVPSQTPLSRTEPSAGKPNGLDVPKISLAGQSLPEKMKVTDFSDFLESPYRYFLSRIFNVGTKDDANSEFGNNTFGVIIHKVLNAFGKSGVKDSENKKEIEDFFSSELDEIVREYESRRTTGTARLQLELIRERLRGFAHWQAMWHKTGARIVATEFGVEHEIKTAAFPFTLTGTIDRIDYNQKHDQWFIFDYKTFDSTDKGKGDALSSLAWINDLADPPAVDLCPGNKTDDHYHSAKVKAFPSDLKLSDETGKPWSDLQLPLYSLLFDKNFSKIGGGFSRGDKRPELALVILKKDNRTEAHFGPWSQNEIDDAFQTARWVCSKIAHIWESGVVDPNALIDGKVEELGHLCEPADDYRNRKNSNASQDILRDFPD